MGKGLKYNQLNVLSDWTLPNVENERNIQFCLSNTHLEYLEVSGKFFTGLLTLKFCDSIETACCFLQNYVRSQNSTQFIHTAYKCPLESVIQPKDPF
ncbi:hypothetical protein PR048_013384 [Dryococelus australis]|uniref:Uncharacterized protein n=1 Tax=Dryococelus australis TaxID=614101 RepID=A0ABQ9HSU6_9NEOP|nr:hypothetical protein PR048_013384 [Dryococelus australis]